MIGVLIVSHGPLAEALIGSSHLILGEVDGVKSIGLFSGDSPELLKDTVQEQILMMDKANNHSGVMVLTDLFGGSPANATARAANELLGQVNVEVVTGASLPMLLEVLSQRDFLSLSELRDLALTSGTQSVMDVLKVLNIK